MLRSIMLILLIVPIANAQQIWYLTGDFTGSTYIMYKIPPKNASKVPIDILPNSTAIWMANEPAKVDLTFTKANWSINLTVNAKKEGASTFRSVFGTEVRFSATVLTV